MTTSWRSHRVAEIVDGDLHASPRPASRHALASSRLGSELGPPFDRGRGGPGGWWILDEPELHLGEDVLVPDLAGWRRERMPQRTLEVYRVAEGRWLLLATHEGAARVRAEPLDAIEWDLSPLWGEGG